MNLIYIIGPARTGTSALTTLLENMGARTLPVTVVGQHNPNYQENAIVNALGEAIHHWASLEPNNMRQHFWEAIGLYIVERIKLYPEPPTNLVVKCPCFPFMVPELGKIAEMITNLGIPTDPYYVTSHRDRSAMTRSANHFTSNALGEEHWGQVYDLAYRRMKADLGDEWIRVDYEHLVEDWETEAQRLADFIPGLEIPVDGGIEPALNHEEMRDAG